jgi:dTDP-4-amino-4,6-dideoxygalactose transaminase
LNRCLRRSFPRVPLAVPFWNRQTYRNIQRCLIAGEVIRGADLLVLQSAIVDLLKVGDALLCGSGSLALELGLRACQVGPGDEVVIPAFCCSAVVAPILAVGATPVLADIGLELNLTVASVDAVVTRKTRAVVVPHLFGNPADIHEIAELGNAKDIVVIDDAAQALGATIDGQPVGSFGDMGIVSFGAEKICFGFGGGALVSQSRGVLDAAREIPLGYPSVSRMLQCLASTQLRRRWRRWTLPAQIILARDKNPAAPPAPYRQERMANLQAALAGNLMVMLSENLAARRARVDAYRELLGDCGGLELIVHRPGSACLTQVIRLLPRRAGDRATQLIAALGAAGIEVQGSYMPIHLLGWARQAVWDSLPFTDQAWTDLIELPCEPTVRLDDVERVASIVKHCAAA